MRDGECLAWLKRLGFRGDNADTAHQPERETHSHARSRKCRNNNKNVECKDAIKPANYRRALGVYIYIYIIYVAMCHLRGALWRVRVKGYTIA